MLLVFFTLICLFALTFLDILLLIIQSYLKRFLTEGLKMFGAISNGLCSSYSENTKFRAFQYWQKNIAELSQQSNYSHQIYNICI